MKRSIEVITSQGDVGDELMKRGDLTWLLCFYLFYERYFYTLIHTNIPILYKHRPLHDHQRHIPLILENKICFQKLVLPEYLPAS